MEKLFEGLGEKGKEEEDIWAWYTSMLVSFFFLRVVDIFLAFVVVSQNDVERLDLLYYEQIELSILHPHRSLKMLLALLQRPYHILYDLKSPRPFRVLHTWKKTPSNR